jgi:SPP1 gp7 family putative phage head morphogenesis protein
MNGAGRAQSIGIDIENQSFMSQWNRNFFFWGADPGTVITYPIEANITPDELDRLSEQWNSGHRSYGRAHKAAILTQGATVAKQGIGQRDMDFTGLAKYNRESVMGVFGVSYSMVGGTENVIRANAEAQLYNFSKWVLTPRLIRIREKLNMFLCPDYGPDLELDYDDPSPENEQMDLDKATRSYQAGVATLNEARAMLKLDPDESGAGEEYYKAPAPASPFGSFGGLSNEDDKPADEEEDKDKKPKKSVKRKKKSFSEAEQQEFWKSYVKRTESFEPKTIKALQEMFNEQKVEVLNNLKTSISRTDKLIDLTKIKESYKTVMTPILTEVMIKSIEAGMNLVTPKNPHKSLESNPETILQVFNRWAIKWLKTRIEWAALETGEETATRLQQILSYGYSHGQSISQISEAITNEFDGYFNTVRADRISRTELITSANVGHQAGYQSVGITKIQIWASEDERTCPLCSTLHGQIHDISEGYLPAYHVNCRCVTIAWIEGVDY